MSKGFGSCGELLIYDAPRLMTQNGVLDSNIRKYTFAFRIIPSFICRLSLIPSLHSLNPTSNCELLKLC